MIQEDIAIVTIGTCILFRGGYDNRMDGGDTGFVMAIFGMPSRREYLIDWSDGKPSTETEHTLIAASFQLGGPR